jgi:hypothetical protein
VGYKWELTILAVVVSIAALIMLLPIEGEPNFGPLVMSEGPDLTLVDEVLTRPSELN